MTRPLAATFAGVVMAAGLVLAQGAPTPPPIDPVAPPSPSNPAQTPPFAPTPGSSQVVIEKDMPRDLTLTGCLVQGSGPSVFLLENARTAAQPSSDTGKTYLVSRAAGSDSVDLVKSLNHKVSVVGTPEEVKAAAAPSDVTVAVDEGGVTVQTTPPATSGDRSSKEDERLMPKLTARSVTSLGDICTTP